LKIKSSGFFFYITQKELGESFYFFIFTKTKNSHLKKLFFLFLFALMLGSDSVQAQQFNFQTFSRDEGLPQSMDIWIGTHKGISKFDGKKFQNFHHPKNDFITALGEDPSGKIWVGTSGGTFQIDGDQFTDFDLPSSRVNCFFYDKKFNLWIGTDGSGVYQMRDEKLIRNFRLADGLSNNNIRSIVQDEDNNLYFGIYDGGVNMYNGAYFSYIRKFEGLSSNLVTTLHREADGKIWVGTQNAGITIWNPADTTFEYLDESDGLANNHVRNIVKDSWGNFWLGTSGGGMSKYSGQQFIHFTKKNGLPGNQVYAIAKDSSENFWLGTPKGVTYFWNKTKSPNGERFTTYDSGLLDVKTKAVFVDNASRVWIGTEGNGLAVFAKDSFQFFTIEEGISGNWIRDIVQDRDGKIWVATAGGGITRIEANRSFSPPAIRPDSIPDSLWIAPPVAFQDDFKFEIFRSGKNGLISNRINDLHVDQKNRVWYATRNNGIGFFNKNSKAYTFKSEEGLTDDHVRSLVEDNLGNLWIGTASQGIFKMNLYGGNFKIEKIQLPPNNTLTSQNIYSLLLDRNQNLWVGSEVGVDKISINKERNPTSINHFGKAEGFLGIETCQNAALVDFEGNLWFGTINGLTKYTPSNEVNESTPPIIHISNVQLNYKNLEDTEFSQWSSNRQGILAGLELPWNKNNLEFEFKGVNLSNPEKVFYQWKMEGYDEDWTPLRQRNFASYPNLPHGKYTFFLKAVNEDGVGVDNPVSINFKILPPIWKTWWFRLVSILLGVFLIGWFIRRRIAAVRRKAAREKEKLEMEKHLLSLEQKALQLQMNPHFIFNALNSIQSLISQKDNKTARYQLAKFSKLMRSILENSRVQAITLDDEIQTLENYLAIEKSSRGDTFDFEFTTLLEADTDELMIPPMMLQPFVENAIIHGVAHLEEKGKIDIHFSQKNNTLECSITDNGIGRAKAKELKSQIEHQHKSAALEVTQERLDILNLDRKIGKSLEIIDLVDAEGNAAGTKVVVKLPVEF